MNRRNLSNLSNLVFEFQVLIFKIENFTNKILKSLFDIKISTLSI